MTRKHGRCWYCGTKLTPDTATLDHVVPKSAGGTGHAWNLVRCCVDCNRRKGALSLEAYRAQHNHGVLFWGESRGKGAA